MAKKETQLSGVALEILEVLKNANGDLTFAEIKEIVPTANPSHLGALKSRGLVNAEMTEITETVKRKVKRNVYSLVNADSETESE